VTHDRVANYASEPTPGTMTPGSGWHSGSPAMTGWLSFASGLNPAMIMPGNGCSGWLTANRMRLADRESDAAG